MFGCAGSSLLHGLFSSCGARAFHCFSCREGFHYCSFQSLEHRLSSCGSWAWSSAACEIFPDQGLNLYLLHWQADSLLLSHQRSPHCGFDFHFPDD